MRFDIKFKESNQRFDVSFGEVQNISDGGYERGYEAGYKEGEQDGHTHGVAEGYSLGHAHGFAEGYEDGLNKREYETWTITYVDGTVEEKEVALL